MERGLAAVAGWGFGVLLIACTPPLASWGVEQLKHYGPADELLKLVADLSRQRPLTVHRVGRSPQKTLRKTDERSNPYFDVFESGIDPKPMVSAIELRIPARGAPDNGGLVILTLSRAQCIPAESIRSHYKREPDELRPSNPSNPRRTYSLTYKVITGEVRFSFDSATDCLVSVAIDQIDVPSK